MRRVPAIRRRNECLSMERSAEDDTRLAGRWLWRENAQERAGRRTGFRLAMTNAQRFSESRHAQVNLHGAGPFG